MLAREVGSLEFDPPVGYVYNPLVYARAPHEMYIARYADGPRRVVFLGMNPGPWGMGQTGVPFGEVTAVREWLGISAPVKLPVLMHQRVPVSGFACTRSEVSGSRLWGYFRERFGSPQRMAKEMFVSNYCPLLFLNGSGANLTPDRISRADQPRLFALCDRYLSIVIETLRPEWLVGVGLFAERRIREVLKASGFTGARVMSITHPSPANPRANRDWAGQVAAALEKGGVFPTP